MKIAHVTATFPPYQGGTGNVCYYNARELARRGHSVHVFTARIPNSQPEQQVDGFQVHRLQPLLRHGNARLLPQLTWELRGFDIIHLHYPFFGGELTALAAWLHRTPLVITYHQDVLLTGWSSLIEKVLRFSAGRATLRSAKRVLFTSFDYSRASYARRLLKGREDTIGELPNGVDTTCFTPGAPASLSLPFKDDTASASVLLVAGLDRAHYFKGVEIFLQALALLPASIHGIIVGEGDLRDSYMALASTLGISPRVFFAGRVSGEALPDYYRLAGVTVLPSVTMGEAFGLVLVESMACGTPVIATRLPGVRTVVNDGVDGYLVEPGQPADLAEKLSWILSDPQRKDEFGRCGRAKVAEKYDWSQIAIQLEAIYTGVRAGERAPHAGEVGRPNG